VLVCKPIGQEDIRTNKAVIQLCREISNQGITAMTFDYYGTGDSSGKFEDITFETCQESIQQTVNYFKNQCDLEGVVVLCIRAGALFVETINKTINPNAFVLWHGVLNGKAYLKELKKQHRAWLLGSFVRKDGQFSNKTELLGYHYNEAFMNGVSEIDVNLNTLSSEKKCLLIDDGKFLQMKLTEGNRVEHILTKNNNFWMKGGLGDSIVPVHDIRSISIWRRMVGVKAFNT
jgi:hypothetical protein